MRAGRCGTRFELAGVAVQNFLGTGRDAGAGPVDDLRAGGIDGKRTDVAPIERKGAAPGHEQAARIANVEVDLVRRTVLRRLLVNVERLGEGLVIDQRL